MYALRRIQKTYQYQSNIHEKVSGTPAMLNVAVSLRGDEETICFARVEPRLLQPFLFVRSVTNSEFHRFLSVGCSSYSLGI